MIVKEIKIPNDKKYLIGFKEIKTGVSTLLECHILKKILFFKKSIFKTERMKGLCPDYYQIAMWTIRDYKNYCKQQAKLKRDTWQWHDIDSPKRSVRF